MQCFTCVDNKPDDIKNTIRVIDVDILSTFGRWTEVASAGSGTNKLFTRYTGKIFPIFSASILSP